LRLHEGLQKTWDGGLNASDIFAQSFKEGLVNCYVRPFQLFSPGAAHHLWAPSGAKRECSHRKSALKAKCSLGDEHCIVKRKTLS